MDCFFVNLPLIWIEDHPGLLDRFLTQGLQPEIGLEGLDLDDPADWQLARDTAETLARADRSHTVHLPFTGLYPAARDPEILAHTRRDLAKALGLARLFSPKRLVGHPYLHQERTSEGLRQAVQRAAETWTEVLAAWPGHPPLGLENTHELSPAPLVELFTLLAGQGTGACFDVGHWHAFARGASRGDLLSWVSALAPFLNHVHLHDNDGSFDQHLGLGLGRIDWATFFGLLEHKGLAPSLTMEPHTEADCAVSLAFVRAHRAWFPAAREVGS